MRNSNNIVLNAIKEKFTDILQQEKNDVTKSIMKTVDGSLPKTEIVKINSIPNNIQDSSIIINNIQYSLENFCNDKTFIQDNERTYNITFDLNTDCNIPAENYEIGDFIGRGGYNTVYEIKINNRNTDKVYRELTEYKVSNKNINDSELNGLFIQRYLSQNKCNTYICKVYEFGSKKLNTDVVNVYAILEKVDSFNKFLENMYKNPYNVNDYKTIFLNILDGLQCISNAGFVHLDIKEDNLGIGTDKNVKLLDFGFLTYIGNADSKNINSYYGTPNYLDPFFMYFYKILKKSDIYSFGIIVFNIFIKLLLSKKIKKDDNKEKQKWELFINRCIYPMTTKILMDIGKKRKNNEYKYLIKEQFELYIDDFININNNSNSSRFSYKNENKESKEIFNKLIEDDVLKYRYDINYLQKMLNSWNN
jgi:serine/threonine protein kinase/RNA-binding protein YhbY